MKFSTVKISFSAEVSAEEMLKILDKDNKALRSKSPVHTLDDILERIDGVQLVTYNGHFGPNLFVEIDKPSKAQDILKQVKEVVNGYIS